MLDQITLEVMADNAPNPAHSSLSVPCSLGQCDVFLSHSWHDDHQAKWREMESWREVFFSKYGRQPSVWFDKTCINQSRISEDLRCLPIFLQGCSRLVVLCGPTYLSRLWCIMELFTYDHMGGIIEDIDVVPIIREGHHQEDSEKIRRSFETFDVRNCECFNKEDKERMLTIIDVAYGSMDGFNDAVRKITERLRLPCSMPDVSTRDSDSDCSSSPSSSVSSCECEV
jgi:hypothetical protein